MGENEKGTELFFLYFDWVFFFTNEIKYSKVEKVKKFMNVKLYGAKKSIVTEPNIKGAKNITKKLLFNKVSKYIFLNLTNWI